MYAGEAESTVSQGNAKSCIQALLKTREQHLAVIKPLSKITSKDSISLNHLPTSSENSVLEITAQNLEFLSSTQSSIDSVPYDADSPENLDYQKDFNYSQKLFHIADGNLYSIFSPIQGRSYGMKPSFLRKQKYTVQECHGRGRKNLRKGLKFHNFLPSESVTSEKDNGYLRTKWKIHSECRLREEHGTKQITISNWSQSIQNPSDDSSDYNKASLKCNSPSSSNKMDNVSKQGMLYSYKGDDNKINSMKSEDVDPYDFNLSLQSNNPSENSNLYAKVSKESNVSASKTQNFVIVPGSKKDSLKLVLSSLMDKPVTTSKKNLSCDENENQTKTSNQKHRRKPTQTRRIVPYMKYLSIIEENESLPLDLSSKCGIESSLSPGSSSGEESQNISGKNILDYNISTITNDKISKDENFLLSNSNSNLFMSSDNIVPNAQLSNVLQSQITTPLAFICPLPVNKKMKGVKQMWPHSEEKELSSSDMNTELTTSQIKTAQTSVSPELSFGIVNQSLPMQYSVQKSFVKETQSKSRRRNQRSVIKQKLEDTFRQNGFLVKTKQVSDGDATFCKFRQLRKYSRYYLKSWRQHLPDEVHKMWKGFLPPKTLLPPISGTSETTNLSAP